MSDVGLKSGLFLDIVHKNCDNMTEIAYRCMVLSTDIITQMGTAQNILDFSLYKTWRLCTWEPSRTRAKQQCSLGGFYLA